MVSVNHLMERYKSLVGDFNPENIIVKPCLRINTLRISEEKLIGRLKGQNVKLEKVPYLEHAYFFDAGFSLASSVEYLMGFIYIQGAASQLPATVLLANVLELSDEKKKDMAVLDMCAAPGSKTTQIATLLNDEIPVVALDENLGRLTAVKYNVERLRLKSVLVYRKDARFSYDIGKTFSHILLDAPCSGNFCIEKDFFNKRSTEDFKNRARLQKELLRSAYKSLESGGTLVYSTCSLEPEEDEMVIDWFLENYEDMSCVNTGLELGDCGSIEVFDQKLNPEIAKTRKFWPHKTGTEGFFIAKLKKA